jgi:hypothetical protein
MGGVYDEVLDFVLGIQDNGENMRFFEPQENAKRISCARQEFGAKNGGAIVLGVAIVILNGRQGLLQSDTGNKSNGYPVVNNSAGDFRTVSRGARYGVLDYGLLMFQTIKNAFALGLRQSVEPKEIFPGGEFLIVANLGGLDVGVEGSEGF